jgi:hypothetical protein
MDMRICSRGGESKDIDLIFSSRFVEMIWKIFNSATSSGELVKAGLGQLDGSHAFDEGLPGFAGDQ